MKHEESWKSFLNWGVVIMFLAMPILVMSIQLFALAHPGWLSAALPREEFNHLREFQRALALLVFGLSGLRTWEVVSNGKKQHNERIENE